MEFIITLQLTCMKKSMSRVSLHVSILLFLCGPSAIWLRAQPQPTPLTVEQAVAEALQKNPLLLGDQLNVPVADTRVVTAGLRVNPMVSAGGDHLDALGTGFNSDNAGGPSEYSLRTDFTLERGGKRSARLGVARAARSVTDALYRNTARGLRLDVQSAFVDALNTRDRVALARESLRFLTQVAELNAARVKAGDLAEVELLRSQLAALQFEDTVRQAELKEQDALMGLQVLLGRRDTAPVIQVAGEWREDAELPALAIAVQQALATRPDVAAMRLDLTRAEAELRSQLAQAKGDWVVGAEYRRQTITAQANTLGFFLSAPLPVFNRNQGEIERARIESRQAAFRHGAVETAVMSEVARAHRQCATARQRLDLYKGRMLGKAREVREIMEFSYRRGDATLLDLLDAQRAFNETMTGYADARSEYAKALYQLDASIGKASGQ